MRGSKSLRMIVAVAGVVVAVLLAAAACGGDDEAAVPETVTVTETVESAAPPETVTVTETEPAPEPEAAPEVAVPIAMDVDTVTSGPGEGLVDAERFCVLENQFKRGMHVVFRMSGEETTTGAVLDDTNVSEAVVRLATGDEIAMNYGQHGDGDDAPFFWTTAWDIPEDFPLGTVDYDVMVTLGDGTTASWTQPHTVPPSVFQVVE